MTCFFYVSEEEHLCFINEKASLEGSSLAWCISSYQIHFHFDIIITVQHSIYLNQCQYHHHHHYHHPHVWHNHHYIHQHRHHNYCTTPPSSSPRPSSPPSSSTTIHHHFQNLHHFHFSTTTFTVLSSGHQYHL